MSEPLRFPAPYFGGKSEVAADVWAALGQPKHYIEPFLGSGAALLARPRYRPGVHVETVNDADGLLSNVWRALQFQPDETARWCDWPVNHVDLMARKKEIIKNEDRLVAAMTDDPKFCDPVIAGYWIWAASCWIGSGLTRPGQIPHVSDGGKGVHALGQIPHVSDGGKGDVPDVREPYNTNLWTWFRRLSDRLRYVRVVCGDWTRVCGGDWQDKIGDVGIFFDPPYGTEATRDPGIYAKDSLTVAGEVRAWCLDRGDRSSYRIVLAGYYEEHESLLAHGWTVKTWKAQGGYANAATGDDETQGQRNRHREALFFSPHCDCEKMELFP